MKPSKYFKIEQEGDTFVLKISECFKEDEGIYTCVATNSAGKSAMKASLKVAGERDFDIQTYYKMVNDAECHQKENKHENVANIHREAIHIVPLQTLLLRTTVLTS